MDVVDDYLACPAYKLACNDPANDSVIHEAASLKARGGEREIVIHHGVCRVVVVVVVVVVFA